MTQTTQAAQPNQPTANVPSVADIPPDPNAENAAPDYSSMSVTDQSIHRCADMLASLYVGPFKTSKYKTEPLPEMMPAYLYRATSSLAQQPMALMRWVIDSWLARAFNEHGANNLLVDASWWPNAPAHLRYETALELARLPAEWRPYALATWHVMTASTKAKGAPDVTPKSNPYAILMQGDERSEPLRTKMHHDAVCALRYDYDPSPYQMYGRGVHAPSHDPVEDWVNGKRDPSYATPVDCGVCLLDAVKAGIRLFRGPGARKTGQRHEDMMRPVPYTYAPETALADTNMQTVVQPEDSGQPMPIVALGQTDDTTLYLNTTPVWQALFADPMYGTFTATLMSPPADENGVAQYTEEYHLQVTQALARLPRWSMLFGDSGDTSGNSEHPLNCWELDADPKPLSTAASTIAQTIQAIGLFGAMMPQSDLIDGVPVTKAQLSKVDPLLVVPIEGSPTPETWYAYARLNHAQELAELTAQLGKSKKPMPAHNTVLKALETPEAQADWLAKQTDVSHRADVADVLGEIEFKLMVLRQVQMRQAEQAIDANIAIGLQAMAAQAGPADMLSLLDDYIRNAANPVAQG